MIFETKTRVDINVGLSINNVAHRFIGMKSSSLAVKICNSNMVSRCYALVNSLISLQDLQVLVAGQY